jgi:hypothetical protein
VFAALRAYINNFSVALFQGQCDTWLYSLNLAFVIFFCPQ